LAETKGHAEDATSPEEHLAALVSSQQTSLRE
jgi:hypothetical protein